MKIDWDIVLLCVCFILLFVLAMFIFFAGISNAAACLEIDVPPGAVIAQYDGDTFELFSPIPPGNMPIRVQGIDTPERRGKQPGWEEAREFTRKWLASGPFHLSTCGARSFERTVAVISRNGQTLADALAAAGHAKPH